VAAPTTPRRLDIGYGRYTERYGGERYHHIVYHQPLLEFSNGTHCLVLLCGADPKDGDLGGLVGTSNILPSVSGRLLRVAGRSTAGC